MSRNRNRGAIGTSMQSIEMVQPKKSKCTWCSFRKALANDKEFFCAKHKHFYSIRVGNPACTSYESDGTASKWTEKRICEENKKKRKANQKKNSIAKEQVNVCRFVEFSCKNYSYINGCQVYTGVSHYKGLQIKNRIYLATGKYKLANAKNLKITRVHQDIPDWATKDQIAKYAFNRAVAESVPNG